MSQPRTSALLAASGAGAFALGLAVGSWLAFRRAAASAPSPASGIEPEVTPAAAAAAEESAGVVISNESRSEARRRSHDALVSRPGPIIIGVAGASGSGKTSISTLLATRLGPSVPVVAISSDRCGNLA